MKLKRKINEAGFTIIELIMVIVIIGIMSAVAIPKFVDLSDSAKLSTARGVGSAISGSIHAEHLITLLMQLRIRWPTYYPELLSPVV